MERKNYSISVEDRSQPATARAYKVIKTENKIRPWIVEAGTGEPLRIGKGGFESREEAEAAIHDYEQYRKPKHPETPGVDQGSEEALLAQQTPSMQQYWKDKATNPAASQDAAWAQALNTQKNPATG